MNEATEQLIARLERERDAAVAVVERIAALGDHWTPCYGVPCGKPDATGARDVCLVHIAPIMAKAAIAKAHER